jgi:transcriptional regulator with XRE-family HTH domain
MLTFKSRSRDAPLITLASNLALARRQTGKSQKVVAQSLGITDVTVSNHERGTTKPDDDLLERYAACYGWSVQELRYGRALPRAVAEGVPVGAFAELSRELPSQLLARAKRAEAEVIDMGADRDEREWFHAQLYGDSTAKLFQMGQVERHRSEAELLKHFESFVTALKANVAEQIAWRHRAEKGR